MASAIETPSERGKLYDQLDEISIEIDNISMEIHTYLATKNKRIRYLEGQKKHVMERINEMNRRAMFTQPTISPTAFPSFSPSKSPTNEPTNMPTHHPSKAPTKSPTNKPTKNPTPRPTHHPTFKPTPQPTEQPTIEWSSKKVVTDVTKKSARRKMKRNQNESANNDEQLLSERMQKHQSAKLDRIHLYDFDFSKDGSDQVDKVKKFEKELLNNPEVGLILTTTTTKIENKIGAFQHALDVLIKKCRMALLAFKPNDKKHVKFIDAMFEILPLSSQIFDGVCSRMVDIFPGISGCIHKVLHDKDFPNSFNIKMRFAASILGEVVDHSMSRLVSILNNTQYGIHKIMPDSFAQEIIALSSINFHSHIDDVFALNQTWDLTKRAVIKLFHSLYRLESVSTNFNIAAIIYEWRQLDKGKNHGTIAVFSGAYSWNKMINDLVLTIGYNDSNIQRLRVSEMHKPRHAPRRGKGNRHSSRYETVFNVTEIKMGKGFLNALDSIAPELREIAVEDINIQKAEDIATNFSADVVVIVPLNGSNRVEMTKEVKRELNNEANDVVIVAINHLPIKQSEVKGSCKKQCVFTEMDFTFHQALSLINVVTKKIDFVNFAHGDEKILITAINSDIFYLTSLNKRVFDTILRSVSSTNTKLYDAFCNLARLQYAEMKIESKYKEWIVPDTLMTSQMVDIMLDFLENTVKTLLINKQFELNQILGDSGYIKSGLAPQGIRSMDIDLKGFFAQLGTLMSMIRSGDAGMGKAWTAFEERQFDVRIRKAALTIGKILYDRKQSNNVGVVRVLCDHIIVELVENIAINLGCKVTFTNEDYSKTSLVTLSS